MLEHSGMENIKNNASLDAYRLHFTLYVETTVPQVGHNC